MSVNVSLREAVDSFKRDGFVNIGPVLAEADLLELRSELERFVATAFHGEDSDLPLPRISQNLSRVEGKMIYHFTNVWEASALFRRLASNPQIVDAAAALAETTDLQIWYDQVQYKPPHSGGAAEWHQDMPYWAPVEPAIVLTAWIALDDADVDNGCMWMVPGSHQWGERLEELFEQRERRNLEGFGNLPPIEPPPGSGPWREPQACVVRAGEVHFHHCLTWHGSPMNRTDRPRRAYAIHYMPRGVRFSGDSLHPLGQRVRVSRGALMLDDPERFPVVFKDGQHVPADIPPPA